MEATNTRGQVTLFQGPDMDDLMSIFEQWHCKWRSWKGHGDKEGTLLFQLLYA